MVHIQVTLVLLAIASTSAIRWQHSRHLDDNFRLLWNLDTTAATITVEVQVRTHGYVGIGFARSDTDRSGADMAIGWVDRGQTYLQDRHFKLSGAGEPRVDPSDDCTLLLGYENATHTVLRFQRAFDTCDPAHDVSITNHTMRVAYMYHADEPRSGSIALGSLPQPNAAFRGIVPLLLGNGGPHGRRRVAAAAAADGTVDVVELRNEDVPLPVVGESLRWCRVFELNDFQQKHHMIRYEPVFGSDKASHLLDQIVLYECQGRSLRLSAMVRDNGRPCHGQYARSAVPCNAIVASWTRGSAGLTFPPEAGIPLDSHKERFYLMESHYSHTHAPHPHPIDLEELSAATLTDDSGLRLHVTAQLRRHDAGVLSVGMSPDWRHIIPPGQERVTSEGHCVDSCTRSTFPAGGISVFAVLLQTVSLGRSVRVRQLRQHEELLPLAVDGSVHAAYAEYRHIEPAARVLPGDRMVVECTYDSTDRDTITVGGAAHGEACNALAVYWPRQKKLTECHSLPSLPTVLHSLGIEALSGASQPVLIAAPVRLAGQTLESRLLSYDWAQQFAEFERVTRSGSFQAVCRDARHKTVLGTDRRLYQATRVQRVWREPVRRSRCQAAMMQETVEEEEEDDLMISNSIDGEPNGFDAYHRVLSMGFSSGATSGVRRPEAAIFCVALSSLLWLKLAFDWLK